VWPANNPTTTISYCLLIVWSSFVLLGRGSYIRYLDWRQPLQVFHLFKCSSLIWLQMTSLPTTKGIPTILSNGTPLVLSLAKLSAYTFPCIPWFLGIHTKVTLLDPLSFSSTCILLRTRADLVVVLQMLLLLPFCQRRYIFLLVTLSDKRSSVYIRIAVTSAWNTVERLPIGILSYGCPLRCEM